jgi:hypothetical protein
MNMIASVTLTDQHQGLTAPLNMTLTSMLPTLGAYSPANILFLDKKAPLDCCDHIGK